MTVCLSDMIIIMSSSFAVWPIIYVIRLCCKYVNICPPREIREN